MLEYIDDHPVVSYRIRFQGRGEIDDLEAQHVRDGMTVVWLVKAICGPPSYHPAARDSDDRYRYNPQKIVDVRPLNGDLAEQAIAYIDHGAHQSYLRSSDCETVLPFTDGFRTDADVQLDELTKFLDDIGELHADERLVDTVARLLHSARFPAPA